MKQRETDVECMSTERASNHFMNILPKHWSFDGFMTDAVFTKMQPESSTSGFLKGSIRNARVCACLGHSLYIFFLYCTEVKIFPTKGMSSPGFPVLK